MLDKVLYGLSVIVFIAALVYADPHASYRSTQLAVYFAASGFTLAFLGYVVGLLEDIRDGVLDQS